VEGLKWTDVLKTTIPTTADVNRGGVYNDLSVDGDNRPRFVPTDAALLTNAFQNDSYKGKNDAYTTWAYRGNACGARSVDVSRTDGGEN